MWWCRPTSDSWGSCKAFLCISSTFHTTYLYAHQPPSYCVWTFPHSFVCTYMCATFRDFICLVDIKDNTWSDHFYQKLNHSMWWWVMFELCSNKAVGREKWQVGDIWEKYRTRSVLVRSASHWLVELGDRSILAETSLAPQNAFFGQLVSPPTIPWTLE